MTYTVSSGTLNPTIPYHTIKHFVRFLPESEFRWVAATTALSRKRNYIDVILDRIRGADPAVYLPISTSDNLLLEYGMHDSRGPITK